MADSAPVVDNRDKPCQACRHCFCEPGDEFTCGHPDAGVVGTYVRRARADGGHCGPLGQKFDQHPLRDSDGRLKVLASGTVANLGQKPTASLLPVPSEREEAWSIPGANHRLRAVIRNGYAFQGHDNLLTVRLERKVDLSNSTMTWETVPGTVTRLMNRYYAEKLVASYLEGGWRAPVEVAAREAARGWKLYLVGTEQENG